MASELPPPCAFAPSSTNSDAPSHPTLQSAVGRSGKIGGIATVAQCSDQTSLGHVGALHTGPNGEVVVTGRLVTARTSRGTYAVELPAGHVVTGVEWVSGVGPVVEHAPEPAPFVAPLDEDGVQEAFKRAVVDRMLRDDEAAVSMHMADQRHEESEPPVQDAHDADAPIRLVPTEFAGRPLPRGTVVAADAPIALTLTDSAWKRAAEQEAIRHGLAHLSNARHTIIAELVATWRKAGS